MSSSILSHYKDVALHAFAYEPNRLDPYIVTKFFWYFKQGNQSSFTLINLLI